MDFCQIFIYKNQMNAKQLRYVLRKILNVKDEKYILPCDFDENHAIFVTENLSIRLVSYKGEVKEIMSNFIEDLKENLNAESFCCIYNDETTWYTPDKFKMKFRNKIKRIINEWSKVN